MKQMTYEDEMLNMSLGIYVSQLRVVRNHQTEIWGEVPVDGKSRAVILGKLNDGDVILIMGMPVYGAWGLWFVPCLTRMGFVWCSVAETRLFSVLL